MTDYRAQAIKDAPSHVHDLRTAPKAYWGAVTPREDQAAYHEILLFGGDDGWRTTSARWLRCLALRIER